MSVPEKCAATTCEPGVARPLLTHTFGCAQPTRGGCCDCGALPADHLRR